MSADGVQFSETQWAGVVSRIKRVGRLDFDPPPPKVVPVINALKEDQRRWCYAFVKSGGNIYEASKAGGYTTPAGQLAQRLLQRQDVRTFIALVFETVQRKLEKKHEARRQQREAEAAKNTAAAVDALTTPLSPEVLPEKVQAQIEKQGSEIAELLEHAFRTLREPIGNYIELCADGSWRIDPAAVKKAPPGVIKSVARDEDGGMRITIADPAEARKFLMDYYQAERGVTGDKGHGDVRTLMVNIINGQPDDWAKLDNVAKMAGAALREARMKTHGAVKIEKLPAPQVPNEEA